MTVAEGGEAVFQVEIANKDIEKVHWKKNGKDISADTKKTTTTSYEQVFTLSVKNLNKNDEATYSCVIGSTKSVARLFIEGKLQLNTFLCNDF